MEAFEDELVFFQRGGYQQAVVEDPEDEGMETMRDGCQGEERAGREGGEDLDEDLPLVSISTHSGNVSVF